MSVLRKILITAGFTLLLVGLGVADSLLTSSLTIYPRDIYKVEKVEAGVARQRDPDVFEVLRGLNIETSLTQKKSLLSRITPAGIPVTSRVLLQNGDGIGSFSFVQSPDVRALFMALKEALHQSFSKDVQDIVDTVEAPPDRPVRNILSFTDPALGTEKIILIRVRERLYEFHLAQGKEEIVEELIDKLTE